MTVVEYIEAQPPAGPDKSERRSKRFRTHLRVLVHCHGRFQTAMVHDLSRGGCRIHGAFGLVPGDCVIIEFMSARSIAGKIVWSLARDVGVALAQALPIDDPLLQPRCGQIRATRATLPGNYANLSSGEAVGHAAVEYARRAMTFSVTAKTPHD